MTLGTLLQCAGNGAVIALGTHFGREAAAARERTGGGSPGGGGGSGGKDKHGAQVIFTVADSSDEEMPEGEEGEKMQGGYK